MPPPDASADAGARSPGVLPPAGAVTGPFGAAGAVPSPGPDSWAAAGGEDTLDLRLTGELAELSAGQAAPPRPPVGDGTGLLDRLPGWGLTATPAGVFRLVPVDTARDLMLVSGWMNDPAVSAFWGLAGPPSVTEDHLQHQREGDGRSVPCLGVLEGHPMSYWEVYRADLAPLARHCPVRPHDTGLHLLIGAVADRGRGLGSMLLAAVTDLVLENRPSCARVLAEPDLRNTPSIAAFLNAGFRFSAEVDLPGKRAALMVRDRAARRLHRPRHA